MNRITSLIWAAGLAATIGTADLLGQDNNNGGNAAGGGRRNRSGQGGQGGGGFDPAQIRQRLNERYREQLAVKDDAEWKIVEARIDKVTEARAEIPRANFGFGRGTSRGGSGGGGGGGGDTAGRRSGGFPGSEPIPELEALQKAIEANASADEIKSKLANFRGVVKQKEAKLEKAQADLRQVLSVKQEAQAVVLGLLK